jgi:ATP-dependent Clp protease, protease subunit
MHTRFAIDPRLGGKSIEEVIAKPKVIVVNAIDEEGARQFDEDFREAMETRQEVIPVVISSFGGEAYAVLTMIDIILSCPVPVATICQGKAMSAGAILLPFGNIGRRYAAENSQIIMHSVGTEVNGRLETAIADVEHTNKLHKQIYQLMAKHCGQPRDYFLNLLRKAGNVDVYLTPHDALCHKMIDSISLPTLVTSITVQTLLM